MPPPEPVIPENFRRPWETGYKILNRHEILYIKKGGMGIVYIVHDHDWNRKFAIKTFQDQFLLNNEIIQRFLAEAETWTNLERHTNIVFANFVERIEGKPLIFLEYIDSGDLSRFIRELSITDSLDFAIQFCNGMEYAYQKLGVIHRDIKPSNVMVQKDSRFRSGYCFKVTDFGLVKALGTEFDDLLLDVSTGLGTVLYMPPEQFSNKIQETYSYSGKVTTRSDIYAFGVTLYLLLTGTMPFSDMKQVFMQDPVHPKIFNPQIPEKLDAVIIRCLEKNPDTRYANFTALKEDLIEIFNGLNPERYVVVGKCEGLTNIDWLNKGVALANLGKFQDAMVCYDKSLAMDLSEPRAWNDRGNTFVHLRQIPEAIRCFDKALELYPGYASAWSRKGIAFAKAGNYPEAICCYDKALGLEPDNAEALSHKGVSLGALGRYQESMECFDRALEIYPRDPMALSNKGSALGRMGKTREALELFNKALTLNSREYMAWFGKGLALANFGKNQEAIECLEKFIELLPSKDASTIQETQRIIRHLIGGEAQNIVPASQGTGQKASGGSLGIPGIDQKSLESLYHQGVSFASRGNFREAIECYDKILTINPKNGLTWNMKGIALASIGKFSEAINCHDKAIEINPGDSLAWNNKGLDLAEIGQFSETIRCYDRALEINPSDALAWNNKGSALAGLREFIDAIKCFDKALELNPKYDMAFFNKGAALANCGDFLEAITCFERFIHLTPPQHSSDIEQARQIIRQLRGK